MPGRRPQSDAASPLNRPPVSQNQSYLSALPLPATPVSHASVRRSLFRVTFSECAATVH